MEETSNKGGTCWSLRNETVNLCNRDMKVAIGMRLKEGPWGGGMQFGRNLAEFLRRRGTEVRFDLEDRDLDIILLTEPRRFSASSAFNDADILCYLMNINTRAVVVQRVNDSNAARGEKLRSPRLAMANRCAHHTVFISRWLQELYRADGYAFVEPTVIYNGANRTVFHADGGALWDGSEKLRIVTHHWSTNWRKGFDVYCQIDALLGQRPYCDLFEVTYVGPLPANVQFRYIKAIQPLVGSNLADVLRAHHVYVTAAQYEAAGMHHIEGSLCGLPVLYRKSGALPEYCDGFGLSFDEGTLGRRLLEMRESYPALKARMSEYPYHAERSCDAYEKLFRDLLVRRDEVLGRRRWTRRNVWILMGSAAVFDLFHRWLNIAKSYYGFALERLLGHDRKPTPDGQ